MSYQTKLINDPTQALIVPKNYCIDDNWFSHENVDAINNYCSQLSLTGGVLFDGEDHSERKIRLHFIQ